MDENSSPPYTVPERGFHPSYHQQPPHTTVVVEQVVMPLMMGPKPTDMKCPHCHKQIVTTVQAIATKKTHLFALLLCLFGCWCCCCLPYCMDSTQTKLHYCPKCNTFIGKYDY